MHLRERIIDILVTDLGWDGDPATLTDELDLVEHGVIDSLRLLSFVNMLEQRLDVRIEDRELLGENFQSVGAVCALVGAKLP